MSARFLLLCLQLLKSTQGQPQKIWIGASAPFTGGGWDAGIPVKVGGDMMMAEVNRNQNLLPGYELNIFWQDDKCRADHARNLFLRNIFEEKYEVFAPGVNRSDLDVDGDNLVEESDTDPLMVVWGRNEVDPPPVAYLGQGCSGGTGPVIPIAFYAQAPFVSPTATFPGLSNRERYPNFYRTQMPDSFAYFAMLDMVKKLGHTRLAILSGTGEEWKTAAAGLTNFASVLSIQLLGRDLTGDIPGFTGFFLPADSATAITDVVSEITKMSPPPRFVMILEYKDPVAALVCEAAKRGFTTAVFMIIGWLEFDWWKGAHSTCTAAQIADVTSSMLMAKMVYWRFDRQQTHTCAPDVTAETLWRRWFTEQGATPGLLSKVDDGYTLYDDGAAAMDAVCMYALALQEMIFVRNFTVQQLAARTPDVYTAWQEVLAATDFEGVIGRVSYLPGKSDPVASVLVQQVKEGGSVSDIATYRGTGLSPGTFTWLGGTNLVFKFSGETAPADSSISLTLATYNTCSGEQTLNFETNQCEDCPVHTRFLPQPIGKCLCVPGYYSSAGTGEAPCLPCEPGNYSSDVGSVNCQRCPVGKASSEPNSTDCAFCARGRYSSSVGQSECTACPAQQTTLTIASEDVTSCICSTVAYTSPGGSGCTACPSNSTSRSADDPTPAPNLESCKCRKNMYMTVPGYSECNKCPTDSSTRLTGEEETDYPGKTSPKSCFCRKDFYMNASQQCEACPTYMVCPEGANAANGNAENLRKETHQPEERFMNLAPGYWSNEEEPFKIFKCADRNRCPGNVPGPFVCAKHLSGRACHHCVENFMWDGNQCVECASFQNNAFMFPILPIIALFVVILTLYKFFGDAYPKWGSWQNSIASLLFIVLNHYQILGILGAFSGVNLPNVLREFLDRYQATNSVSFGFGLSCVGLAKLVPSMVAKAIAPAVVILATLITYYAFIGLAKAFKTDLLVLEKNRLGNVLGSLMFTFFSAISSMSLALFRCSANPSDEPTLSIDLSVICWTSSTWLAALGIGIVCVLLYIIGMGGIFLRVIYVAPRHFADQAFQMRWKFLFIKFHAGAYWWGIVFLGKNFLINFIPVVWTDDVARLYISMTVIMVYLGMVAAKLPFRATVANVFEIMVGASILYVASLLTWFVERDLDREKEDNRLGLSAVIISLGPLFCVPLGCLYLYLHGRKAHPSSAQLARAESEFNNIRGSFSIFSRLETVDAVGILLHMSEGDRRTLKNADFLIRTDVIGVESAMRVAGDRSEEVKRFTRRITESGENLDGIDPLTGVPKMCCVSV